MVLSKSFTCDLHSIWQISFPSSYWVSNKISWLLWRESHSRPPIFKEQVSIHFRSICTQKAKGLSIETMDCWQHLIFHVTTCQGKFLHKFSVLFNCRPWTCPEIISQERYQGRLGEWRTWESLDLSSIKLNGEIPVSISSLSFLKFLNCHTMISWDKSQLGLSFRASVLLALLGILGFVELLYKLTAQDKVVMFMCQSNMVEAMMMSLKLSHSTLGWLLDLLRDYGGLVVLYSSTRHGGTRMGSLIMLQTKFMC